MKTRPYTLLYILLLCLLASVRAEARDLRFSNHMVPTTPGVLAFSQDEQGMMWLGTGRGLYSFDGFTCYPHRRPDAPAGSIIHTLLRQGHLFYIGAGDGLITYDIRANRYTPVVHSPRDVRALLLDGGRLYVGAEGGLYIYAQGRFRRVPGIHHSVYSLLRSGDRILVGTLHGVYMVSARRVRLVPLGTGRQPFVNALLLDPARRCVWIGTEGALYALRRGAISEEPALRGNSVKTLALKADGTLFIGTDNGLYTLRGSHEVERSAHDSRYPSTLINNIVWTIFTDRSDNVWLGTDVGFSLLEGNSALRWVSLSDITRSGEGNSLHVFFQDRSGTCWAGGTDGIIRFRPQADGYTDVAWYRFGNSRYPLSHNRVRDIYQDADGTLWIATDHGINCYDPTTQQFRNFIVTSRSGTATTAWAYGVVMDRRHRLWISSYQGLFAVSKQKLLASSGSCVADLYLSERDGLPCPHLRTMVFDGRGNLWCLPQDHGLVCVPAGQWRPRVVGSPNIYQALAVDATGRVWAAADGRLDIYSSTAKPQEITLSGSDEETRVQALCAVGSSMWVVTGNVCRIYDLQGKSVNFSLPSSNINAAYYSARDGVVRLEGNDGFYELQAHRVARLLRQAGKGKATVRLAALLVNGDLYDREGTSVSYRRDITLNHDENDLTFCLTSLPYSTELPPLYAYQLEGRDKTWTTLDSPTPRIAYSQLPYGRYRLVVRALDGSGQPSGEVYSLAVRILPPWYLTLWAKLVYALLAAALLVWLHYFRRVRQRLRQTQREKQHILEQVRSKANFYAGLAKDLNRHLRPIMATANLMLSPAKREKWKTDPELTLQGWETMRRQSADLASLVHRKLSVDKASPTDGEDGSQLIDTTEHLRLLVDDTKERAKAKKLTLSFATNTEVLFQQVDIITWHNIFSSLMDYLLDHSEPRATITVTVRADMVAEQVTYELGSSAVRLLPEQRAMMFQTLSPLYEVPDYVRHNGGLLRPAVQDGKLGFSLIFDINRTTAMPIEPTSKEPDNEGPDERLLAEITAAIEENIINSDFNVSRLQEAVGMGSKQLYRKTKLLTGMTPVELIRSLRMRRAATLLKEGKFAVSEVMYMVGYSDSSYFSKCFQKAFGVKPTQYK